MTHTTTTIFFDESGFTGDDLLNPEQPYFCVASSIIPDDEARDLLHTCFPRYRAHEYKFGALCRRASHRQGLLELARLLPALGDRTFVWVMDKRFCLLTKMADYLVEPLVYHSGFDFYAGGWAQRYCNTVHQDILRFGSEELYQETVMRWNALARRPSDSTLAELQRFLRKRSRDVSPPIDNLYKLLHRGAELFQATNPVMENFTDSSEIQLTSVLTSVIHWRQRRSEDFSILHDESSNFFKQHELWSAATRDDFTPRLQTLGDGSTVEFPLRVRFTRPIASESSPAIQLCDVIAGLFARAAQALSGRPLDDFMRDVVDAGLGAASFAGVLPGPERQVSPPRKRVGPDAVDAMAEILAPALKGKSRN
ncbi:MAG: DUF3800 domain-containing protein [Pseudomonadota bacterium]|nr:DUF3800 domain-containing protein [Pseudomonadota bacterium]